MLPCSTLAFPQPVQYSNIAGAEPDEGSSTKSSTGPVVTALSSRVASAAACELLQPAQLPCTAAHGVQKCAAPVHPHQSASAASPSKIAFEALPDFKPIIYHFCKACKECAMKLC